MEQDVKQIDLKKLFSIADVLLTGSRSDLGRGILLQTQIFFKKIRPPSQGNEYLDLLCELVCSVFGKMAGAPLLTHIPAYSANLGLGLVSQYLGDKLLNQVPRDNVVNSDKLPFAFVFEELIMNQDDKAEHIRVRQISDSKYEFAVVDHGHTLHAWKPQFQNPEMALQHGSIFEPSSSLNEYGVRHISELIDPIARLSSVTDSQIDNAVSMAFYMLQDLQVNDHGLDLFLSNKEQHFKIISAIIRTRRDNLNGIIKSKCSRIGVVVDN